MSNEDKGIIQRFIAMSKCCSQHDRSARRRMLEEEGLRKAVPRWQQAAGRALLHATYVVLLVCCRWTAAGRDWPHDYARDS